MFEVFKLFQLPGDGREVGDGSRRVGRLEDNRPFGQSDQHLADGQQRGQPDLGLLVVVNLGAPQVVAQERAGGHAGSPGFATHHLVFLKREPEAEAFDPFNLNALRAFNPRAEICAGWTCLHLHFSRGLRFHLFKIRTMTAMRIVPTVTAPIRNNMLPTTTSHSSGCSSGLAGAGDGLAVGRLAGTVVGAGRATGADLRLLAGFHSGKGSLPPSSFLR